MRNERLKAREELGEWKVVRTDEKIVRVGGEGRDKFALASKFPSTSMSCSCLMVTGW